MKAVLLVAAIVVIAAHDACAQARPDGSAGPIAPASSLPGTPTGFLGYTFCRNGLAESWVRADMIGTPQQEEILAHEAVHRQQAGEYPTCEEWLASLKSARRIIDVEIPAYCAQRKVAVAHGANGDELTRDYIFRIAAQSGATENRLDIQKLFRERCDP